MIAWTSSIIHNMVYHNIKLTFCSSSSVSTINSKALADCWIESEDNEDEFEVRTVKSEATSSLSSLFVMFTSAKSLINI